MSSNNVDFAKAVGSLVVFRQGSSNDTKRQISVSIIDDTRTESTESFSVELSAVNAGGLVAVNPSSATVKIVDDDSMFIFFYTYSFSQNLQAWFTLISGTGDPFLKYSIFNDHTQWESLIDLLDYSENISKFLFNITRHCVCIILFMKVV